MGGGHVVSWLFVDMSGFELFCVLGVLSSSITISFVLKGFHYYISEAFNNIRNEIQSFNV